MGFGLAVTRLFCIWGMFKNCVLEVLLNLCGRGAYLFLLLADLLFAGGCPYYFIRFLPGYYLLFITPLYIKRASSGRVHLNNGSNLSDVCLYCI